MVMYLWLGANGEIGLSVVEDGSHSEIGTLKI
jgi:hypothetical protein